MNAPARNRIFDEFLVVFLSAGFGFRAAVGAIEAEEIFEVAAEVEDQVSQRH